MVTNFGARVSFLVELGVFGIRVNFEFHLVVFVCCKAFLNNRRMLN